MREYTVEEEKGALIKSLGGVCDINNNGDALQYKTEKMKEGDKTEGLFTFYSKRQKRGTRQSRLK